MFKPTKRYQPERYFMRGPGPKWLEKHGEQIDREEAAICHDIFKPRFSFFVQLVRSWCRH